MFLIRWLLLVLLLVPLPCQAVETASELYQHAMHALHDGHVEEALQHAQRLKQHFPQSLQASEVDYISARAWEWQGKVKLALQAYQRFLQLHTQSVHRIDAQLKVSLIRSGVQGKPEVLALMLKALRARALSDGDAAVGMLQDLVQRYPSSRLADDALNMLAYIQLVDVQQWHDAEQSYRHLLQAYPRSNYVDSALYGLASALEVQKKWTQSQEVYQRLKAKHSSSIAMMGLSFPKDNYLSRVWFQKADARLQHMKKQQQMEAQGLRFIHQYGFPLGVGDRVLWAQPVGSGQHYQPIWKLLNAHGLQAQMVTHWVTKQSDWRWETPNRLQALVQSGHTPVIADWYFGDAISPKLIAEQRQAYVQHIQEQLIPLIRGLPEVWVFLEPEFNKHGVEKSPLWGALSVQVVDMIHQKVPGARVGLVLGNWLERGDDTWVEVMRETIEHSDFIGFQEMLSASDGHAATEASWNPLDRTMRLLTFLQTNFHKPIYLAYLAVSSAVHWEHKQATIIQHFRDAMPEMAYHGVIGASYFALLDDPLHQGWFVEAEQHLGLLSASGQEKPALSAWKSWESQNNHQDDVAPYLLRTPMVHGLPMRAGQAMTVYAQSNEWCRWHVRIEGVQSHAVRVFSGAGRDVRVQWQGWANDGAFIHQEDCRVQLVLQDASGKQTVQQMMPDCHIQQAIDVHQMQVYPYRYDQGVYPWGTAVVDERDDVLHLAWNASASGVAIAMPDYDWRTDDGILRLRLRVGDAGIHGVQLVLKDEHGVEQGLWLEAYVRPDKSGLWQDVLVPLHDFTHNARQPLDWQKLQYIQLSSGSDAAALDIQHIQIVQR